MANKPNHGSKGYLRACLADGATPFLYRGRVRALLGLPQAGGVTMNFPGRLPTAGFNYVIPKFTGEFDLPDNVLSESEIRNMPASETRNVQARKRPLSNVDSPLTRHPAAPEPHRRDTSPVDSVGRKDGNATSHRHEVAHVVALPGVSRRSLGATAVPSPLHGTEMAGGAAAKAQISAVESMDAQRNTPAPKTLNVTCSDNMPGLVKVLLPAVEHAASSTPGKRVEFASPADSRSQRWQDLSPQPLPPEQAVPGPAVQRQPMDGVMRTDVSALIMPQPSHSLPSKTSRRTVSRDTPCGDETSKPWEEHGFPVRRLTHPEAKSGKKIPKPDREMPPDLVRPASPVIAPPQVVIVQQAAQRSVSPAFWERRYLNRVRARVRQ